MPKFEDLTGINFGRLTVLERADDYVSPSGVKKVRWLCKCACGNYTNATSADLKRGDVKSCGCFAIESKIKNATTHGLSNEKLYTIWKGIKARCYNKNHKNYKDYGGRGITMCDEWKDSYISFKNWCTDNNYRPGLTIERINNDLPYSPSNCKLATRKEQASNRRSNKIIEYNGESHNIKWWSDKTGIPYMKLYYGLSLGHDIGFIVQNYK